MNKKSTKNYHLYKSYILHNNKALNKLSSKKRNEILFELKSYIYEELLQSKNEKEIDFNTLLKNKTLDFNTIFNQVSNKKNKFLFYLKRNISFILDIVGFFFVILFLSKIFFPNNTGLFYINNQLHSFGIIFSYQEKQEVIGYKLLPISFLLAITFLFLSNRIKNGFHFFNSIYDKQIKNLIYEIYK